MHPLKNYLKKNNIKVHDFAEKINRTPRMVFAYINENQIPSPETAKKISELTGISVTKLLYPEDDDV